MSWHYDSSLDLSAVPRPHTAYSTSNVTVASHTDALHHLAQGSPYLPPSVESTTALRSHNERLAHEVELLKQRLAMKPSGSVGSDLTHHDSARSLTNFPMVESLASTSRSVPQPDAGPFQPHYSLAGSAIHTHVSEGIAASVQRSRPVSPAARAPSFREPTSAVTNVDAGRRPTMPPAPEEASAAFSSELDPLAGLLQSHVFSQQHAMVPRAATQVIASSGWPSTYSESLTATSTQALEGQLERYRGQVVRLESDLERKNTIILNMEREARAHNDTSQLKTRQLEASLGELQGQSAADTQRMITKMRTAEQSISSLTLANGRLEEQALKVNQQLHLLQSEVGAAKGRQMEAEVALSRYSTEREDMQRKIALLTTDNTTVQQLRRECDQLRGLRDDCATLRQSLEDAERQLATERAKRRDSERAQFDVEQRLATEEATRRRLEADMRSVVVISAEKGAAQRELDEVKAANTLLKDQIDDYRRTASAEHDMASRATKERDSLLTEVQGQLLKIRQDVQASYHDAEEAAQRANLLQQQVDQAVASSGGSAPSSTGALDSAAVSRAFLKSLRQQLGVQESAEPHVANENPFASMTDLHAIHEGPSKHDSGLNASRPGSARGTRPDGTHLRTTSPMRSASTNIPPTSVIPHVQPSPLTAPDAPLRPLYNGIKSLAADIISSLYHERVVKGKRLMDEASEVRAANDKYVATIRSLTQQLTQQTATVARLQGAVDGLAAGAQHNSDNAMYMKELAFGQMRHLFEEVLGKYDAAGKKRPGDEAQYDGATGNALVPGIGPTKATKKWLNIIQLTSNTSSAAPSSAQRTAMNATSLAAALAGNPQAASTDIRPSSALAQLLGSAALTDQLRYSSSTSMTYSSPSSPLVPASASDAIPPLSTFTDKTWRYLWEHLTERVTAICEGDGSYKLENDFLQETVKDLSLRVGEYRSRLEEALKEQQALHQQHLTNLHLQHEEELKKMQRTLNKSREVARANEASAKELPGTEIALKQVRSMYSELKEDADRLRKDLGRSSSRLKEARDELTDTSASKRDVLDDYVKLEAEVEGLQCRLMVEVSQSQRLAVGLVAFIRFALLLQHKEEILISQRNVMQSRCHLQEQHTRQLSDELLQALGQRPRKRRATFRASAIAVLALHRLQIFTRERRLRGASVLPNESLQIATVPTESGRDVLLLPEVNLSALSLPFLAGTRDFTLCGDYISHVLAAATKAKPLSALDNNYSLASPAGTFDLRGNYLFEMDDGLLRGIAPVGRYEPAADATHPLVRLVANALHSGHHKATAMSANYQQLEKDLADMANTVIHQTELKNKAQAECNHFKARIDRGEWVDRSIADAQKEALERLSGRLQLEESTRARCEAELHVLASKEVDLIAELAFSQQRLQSLALRLAAEMNAHAKDGSLYSAKAILDEEDGSAVYGHPNANSFYQKYIASSPQTKRGKSEATARPEASDAIIEVSTASPTPSQEDIGVAPSAEALDPIILDEGVAAITPSLAKYFATRQMEKGYQSHHSSAPDVSVLATSVDTPSSGRASDRDNLFTLIGDLDAKLQLALKQQRL